MKLITESQVTDGMYYIQDQDKYVELKKQLNQALSEYGFKIDLPMAFDIGEVIKIRSTRPESKNFRSITVEFVFIDDTFDYTIDVDVAHFNTEYHEAYKYLEDSLRSLKVIEYFADDLLYVLEKNYKFG